MLDQLELKLFGVINQKKLDSLKQSAMGQKKFQ